MKTKLTGLLIILSVTIISCNSDIQQGNSELLTSTNWTDNQNLLSSYPASHYIFHKNGDYTLELGEIMTITGQWKWTSKNEIYLEWKSITANGNQKSLDKKQNYYIRIIEISEKNLKTLERFETDSWDSGFAKEMNYKSM